MEKGTLKRELTRTTENNPDLNTTPPPKKKKKRKRNKFLYLKLSFYEYEMLDNKNISLNGKPLNTSC